MSNSRATLASYRTRQKEIADQAHQLNVQEWELENQIQELKRRIVKEETLLQANVWQFRRSRSSFYLDGGREKDWPDSLVNLIGDSPFGSPLDFPNGATLHINDGEIWLSFETAEMGFNFIQEYGLVVDASQLATGICAIKEELQALQALNESLSTRGGKHD